MATVILCTSCTHKKQGGPVTWLYSDGDLEMLQGRVKTLTDLSMDTGKMFIYWVYTFDKKGNLVTVDDIYNGGMNTTKYTTTYSKIGKKAQTIGLHMASSYHTGDVATADVYNYDNSEHITGFCSVMYKPNTNYQPPFPCRFLYDKAGYLTERQESFQERQQPSHEICLSIRKFKYLHDDNNIIIGEEWATADEKTGCKVFTKDTTRYLILDSHNNWLKAVRFGNDTLTRKIIYYRQ